jgi:hypothetical protein
MTAEGLNSYNNHSHIDLAPSLIDILPSSIDCRFFIGQKKLFLLKLTSLLWKKQPIQTYLLMHRTAKY